MIEDKSEDVKQFLLEDEELLRLDFEDLNKAPFSEKRLFESKTPSFGKNLKFKKRIESTKNYETQNRKLSKTKI